jgi:quercetin dioxygenase-like cupin family protein
MPLRGLQRQGTLPSSWMASGPTLGAVPWKASEESADSPLFTGGRVTRQSLVTPEMGNNFSINIVNFSAGARNKMYIHTSDQVLFVTAGKGIIAIEATEEVITTGDVVHVSAGEKHWHGETPDSAFSHIALTAKGSKTTQVEE